MTQTSTQPRAQSSETAAVDQGPQAAGTSLCPVPPQSPEHRAVESNTAIDLAEPHRTLEPILEGLQEQLAELNSHVQHVRGQQATLSREVQQLGVEQSVFNDTHEQYRQLREHLFEREILLPILLSLIGLADRCQQEITKLRTTLKILERNLNLDVVLAIRHVIGGREADLVEVETLLANHGVESFTSPSPVFDRQQQECVKPLPTKDRGRQQHIAVRVQPGYRRDGKIIRRERVNVFVYSLR